MKKTKRLFSLLLTLVMILALAVPALADGEESGSAETTDGTTYTITITASDVATDHSYKAYQIFSGNIDGDTLTDVVWGSDVDTESEKGTDPDQKTLIEAIKAITLGEGSETSQPFAAIAQDTAASVADVLAQYKNDSELVKQFANTVAQYLKTDDTVGAEVGYNSNSQTYTATNLEAGYYLIQDSKQENTSGLMLQVVGNVNITDKTDVPSVTKYAGEEAISDNASFGFEQEIPYTLIGTLPSDGIPTDVTKYIYTFTDTMDATLDLSYTPSTSNNTQVDGGVTVKVHHTDENGFVEKTDVTNSFTITYAENEDGKHVLTVTGDLKVLTNLDNPVTVAADDTIVVTYNATINTTAAAGQAINNTVVVTTENTTTPEIKETVYPLELDITKVDGASGITVEGITTYEKKLADAQFVLYYQTTTVEENTTTTITNYYAEVGSNNKVIAWHSIDVSNMDEAAIDAAVAALQKDKPSVTLTSGTNGEIAVIGLGEGSYYLKETKAPEGYNMLSNDIKLEIDAEVVKDTATGIRLATLTIETDDNGKVNGTIDEDTAKVSTIVENNQGAQLPSTGGIGTTIFYVIGGILVLGAAVLLITRKRMDRE